MIGPNGKMRVFTTRAALAAFTALAGVSTAGAQWFPPIGAAAPREIVERLRADGYVLIGPLQRRETVYLADVNAGRAGHERLVIDAWSGAILQRFVYRPRYARPGSGGFVVEVPPERLASFEAICTAAGATAVAIGTTGGSSLHVNGLCDVPLERAAEAWSAPLREVFA